MSGVDRRQFLETAVAGAASMGLAMGLSACSGRESSEAEGVIIDTNVDILGWPFRELKYGDVSDLVAKLRRHRVKQAWTGSYEALFHKNIDAVNARLARACEERGDGLLVPFGAVNPAWPDWQEDLRRVDEVYGMPGIKLYPSYQNYNLGDPEVEELIRRAADRDLVVVITVDMEDERVHHPRLEVTAADVRPLAGILPDIPAARVVLANVFRHVRGDRLQAMVEETDVLFDIARLDGTGGIYELTNGTHWYLDTTVPAERLVFGSHAPFFPVENSLLKFMESPITEAQAHTIMYENVEAWAPVV
jgi:predicted TIM-barrel fold metal-dependent hydrolase